MSSIYKDVPTATNLLRYETYKANKRNMDVIFLSLKYLS